MTVGRASDGTPTPAEWQRAAFAFASAVESGRLDLPLPGSGATWRRWAALADLAEEDLSLARLGEGHADAVAILAELGGPPPQAGRRWGVWAANPPGPNVTASRQDGGWLLRGTKQYCSGARVCTHALVTAAADDGLRLFAVPAEQLEPDTASWPATGMAGSDTLDVGFPGIAAVPVGPPDGYVNRPGFSHGGVGVAACWYGGARAVAWMLLSAASKRDVGPHALAVRCHAAGPPSPPCPGWTLSSPWSLTRLGGPYAPRRSTMSSACSSSSARMSSRSLRVVGSASPSQRMISW